MGRKHHPLSAQHIKAARSPAESTASKRVRAEIYIVVLNEVDVQSSFDKPATIPRLEEKTHDGRFRPLSLTALISVARIPQGLLSFKRDIRLGPAGADARYRTFLLKIH